MHVAQTWRHPVKSIAGEDPDTLEQDQGVLKDIVARFGGRLALNCAVLRGGTVSVGQEVEVVGR